MIFAMGNLATAPMMLDKMEVVATRGCSLKALVT